MCKLGGGRAFCRVLEERAVASLVAASLFAGALGAAAEPLKKEDGVVRESYVLVEPPRTPAPTPSPDAPTPEGDWYGHWHLLSGTVLAGLYTLAIHGTQKVEGEDEQVGAGIGTGYLLLGFAMSGAGIHAAHDNEVGAVLSGVMRLLGGALAPGLIAAACDPSNGDSCDTAITIAAAVSTATPVMIDSFLLAWD